MRISAIEETRRSARARLLEIAQTRSEMTQEFNSANRDHAEALAVLENLHLAGGVAPGIAAA